MPPKGTGSAAGAVAQTASQGRQAVMMGKRGMGLCGNRPRPCAPVRLRITGARVTFQDNAPAPENKRAVPVTGRPV